MYVWAITKHTKVKPNCLLVLFCRETHNMVTSSQIYRILNGQNILFFFSKKYDLINSNSMQILCWLALRITYNGGYPLAVHSLVLLEVFRLHCNSHFWEAWSQTHWSFIFTFDDSLKSESKCFRHALNVLHIKQIAYLCGYYRNNMDVLLITQLEGGRVTILSTLVFPL